MGLKTLYAIVRDFTFSFCCAFALDLANIKDQKGTMNKKFEDTRTKYVLSDLDGVIRHFPAERTQLIEKKFGLPEGAIHTAAFERFIVTRSCRPRVGNKVSSLHIPKKFS